MPHFAVRSFLSASILLTFAVAVTPATAQTFTILHTFSGAEGANPSAGLFFDAAGNLYGTTGQGGDVPPYCAPYGCGTVFRLKPTSSGWVLESLYKFHGYDGADPQARIILGPDGSLYGTTSYGGVMGYGTVFRLTPAATPCRSVSCPWTETVLYAFHGGSDAAYPLYGDLIFDQSGNIYGTTYGGGAYGYGAVFELSRSNGGWTEKVLYSFGSNGRTPFAGVILDSSANLYGTTVYGGPYNAGTVYELTHSVTGWTEHVLYSFDNSGSGGYDPYGGLIFDSVGNLYGTTHMPGQNGTTVYELTPANGGWTYRVLYALNADIGSYANLTMDTMGDLYGTLFSANIEVFRLTPSDGQWTLSGFDGSAGSGPIGNVILDRNGNVYGTTFGGGLYNDGVVFEITP